jgi:hypothetical protein
MAIADSICPQMLPLSFEILSNLALDVITFQALISCLRLYLSKILPAILVSFELIRELEKYLTLENIHNHHRSLSLKASN